MRSIVPMLLYQHLGYSDIELLLNKTGQMGQIRSIPRTMDKFRPFIFTRARENIYDGHFFKKMPPCVSYNITKT